jgi:hypothetical protein
MCGAGRLLSVFGLSLMGVTSVLSLCAEANGEVAIVSGPLPAVRHSTEVDPHRPSRAAARCGDTQLAVVSGASYFGRKRIGAARSAHDVSGD